MRREYQGEPDLTPGGRYPANIIVIWTRMKSRIYRHRRLRETVRREMIPVPAEIAVSSMEELFMEELKQVMENHLSEMEFGVDQLAGALYMSRATLNRRIKALTGKSTNQFIKLYRLERAVQLLQANAGNVTEIAFRVGFSDCSYFTRCFRETFQQLPHQCRVSQSDGGI
ncbi:MAG: helix-turn-helix transcriptional regulator [bacterium]|nr:helix-turn-helix transcriptional regulator [bacterium]